ncbi:protein-disulfide reductase DsbD domain-containing protein [Bosea sp. PAMC 26642]|uniref:protein-disulfide reductase DsbD domain-containing protein n=1 Tax=Bosea sp. (strain PAMC 26642) TaxID=1792307 RepID=UPI00143AF081|nr:protein-disulfide reductase DsbD domain-containing protein [Bosea sp. PAMC 26642]
MKRIISIFLFSLLAFAAPAGAQEAATSLWSKGDYSSLRLIAGPTAPSGKQRVGVEIVMAPGYKTYWRSPGDFGVPPVFDWSGSANVGGLDVRWPAPERFEDASGYSVGYIGEVVIPISVKPADPAKPVTLVLKLDYAVCEKICIPAKGEARLWLEPGVTAVSSPRLERFEEQVPNAVKIGPNKDKPSILDAKIAEGSGDPVLKLVLRASPDGSVDDVFVEGPGSWSFGKPVLRPQPDGTIIATVKMSERPKSAAGPVPFIITVRGKPAAVETRLELDIPAAKP